MAAINALSRTFWARLTFTDTDLTITDDIFSVKYQSGSNADTALTMGTTTSATVTIETIYISGKSLKSKWFTLDFGVKTGEDYEYFPVGEFYVRECTRSGDKMTITAADRMSKFDKVYSTIITFPVTADIIFTEMQKKYGFTADTTGLENVMIPFRPAVKTTVREFIGKIAALAGKNACFDRNGILRFYWYSDNNAEVSADYVDEPDVDEQDFTVKYLLYNISDKTTDIYGDENADTGITLDNEFVLAGQQTAVWSAVNGFSYRPAVIKQRIGNPLIDSWDIITLTMGTRQYKVLPMWLDINFDGGIQVTITSTAPEDEKDYKSPSEIAAEKQAEKDESLQLVLTTSNASAITLTTTDQLLCDLDFSISADALPYVMATVQLSEVTAEVVTMTLMINSQVIQIFNLNAVDGYNLATFVQAFLALSQGTHNLQLYIRSGGAGKVEAQRGQIVLTGSGLSANAGWNGLLSLDDIYNIIIAKKRTVTFLDFNEEYSVELLTPIPIAVSDSYSVLIAKKRQVSVTELVDTLPYRVLNAYNDGYNTIYIEYSNPIYFGGVIDKQKATVTGFRTGVPEVVEVLAVGLEKVPAPSLLGDLTLADGTFSAECAVTADTEYTVTFLRTFPKATTADLQGYNIGQLEYLTARQIESVPYVCELVCIDSAGEEISRQTVSDYYTFKVADNCTAARVEIKSDLVAADIDGFVVRLEEGISSYYQYSNRIAISTSSLEGLDSVISYSITDSNITSPITSEVITVQGSFAMVTATAESEG